VTTHAISPLESRLRGLRADGRAGLVPFLTAGYPDRATCARLLLACARAGAAAIELGLPFSDPLADGPALQEASQVALDGGTTVAHALDLVREFTATPEGRDVPVVVMTYANPVLAYGVERFAQDAAAAGVRGIIVSDLPLGERSDVWAAFAAAGLDIIPLIAPTTAPARVAGIVGRASGFVYCLSRTGVTGDSRVFSAELDEVVRAVRARTDVPVGIGFGIDDAAKARFVAEKADAVIVGAAIARRIAAARAGGGDAVVAAVEPFVRELVAAVSGVHKSK
jgi:tryptophan synthase alpha chain